MNTREKIQEIIGLIYDLNEKTEYEWFFSFAGHVKTVSVHYVHDKSEADYLTYGTDFTLQIGLNDLIKELKTYLPT